MTWYIVVLSILTKFPSAPQVPVCECEHGTCGPQCDQCCPLFNQELWRTSIPCQACQCFGRAESCHFDGETAKHQLSLDTTGQRRGGGVCENCTVSICSFHIIYIFFLFIIFSIFL